MRVFAGIPVLIVVMLGLGLSACGQRGPLMLPHDEAARNSKAIYIIPQKQLHKASDDVEKPNAEKPTVKNQNAEKVVVQ
jgi:predicted small lipoprotein YifL